MEEKWLEFMQDGDAYLKTARGGQKRPSVFTPEILYNLLAMAIEKHIMAALIFKGTLADNHTFTDMIQSAKELCPLDDALVQTLTELESYQEICSVFDGYNRKKFPAAEVSAMIAAAEEVQQWSHNITGWK